MDSFFRVPTAAFAFAIVLAVGFTGGIIPVPEAGAQTKFTGHSLCARVMNKFVKKGKAPGRGKGYHAIAFTAEGTRVSGCGGPDKGMKSASEAKSIAVKECKKHSGGKCNRMLGPILIK